MNQFIREDCAHCSAGINTAGCGAQSRCSDMHSWRRRRTTGKEMLVGLMGTRLRCQHMKSSDASQIQILLRVCRYWRKSVVRVAACNAAEAAGSDQQVASCSRVIMHCSVFSRSRLLSICCYVTTNCRSLGCLVLLFI